MIKLQPITLENLKVLAALAPQDEESLKPTIKDKKKSQPREAQGADLGHFQIDKYLDHYGIAYTVKAAGSKTIYKLHRCLFDPSHTKNESSIVQDASGLITYQCFHDHCNYRWKDARQKISGEAKLTQFFKNYDPNYKPQDDEPGTGLLKDLQVEPTSVFTVSPPELPPPRNIDPMEFFRETKSGRIAFVPERMAKYYVSYFKNLVHTSGVFWVFRDGLWQEISEFVLNQVCVQCMKEYITPNMIDGSIKVLRGLVNREPKEWPDSGGYINCLNGMIDIYNGMTLIPHDPLLGSRTQVPCNFDIKNLDQCDERWFPFLDEVFPGEEDKADLMQQFFGYCLMMDCRFEKMLFLIGSGGNGKGTALHMLNEIVGAENTSSLTMRDLSDPKFSLYFLQNKLVNVATETSHRDPVATEHLKTIVSGEWLTAERKHGHKFQFKPYVKMILSMNELPVIPDRSYGLERRLLILRFNQRFTDDTKDPDLKAKLSKARDGVFTWALMGLEKLLNNNGFIESGEVMKDKRNFMKSLHPLLQFVEEKCLLGRAQKVEINDLHKVYCKWCEEGQYRKLARNRFTEQILNMFPTVERKPHSKNRRIHFMGIAPVSEFDTEEE